MDNVDRQSLPFVFLYTCIMLSVTLGFGSVWYIGLKCQYVTFAQQRGRISSLFCVFGREPGTVDREQKCSIVSGRATWRTLWKRSRSWSSRETARASCRYEARYRCSGSSCPTCGTSRRRSCRTSPWTSTWQPARAIWRPPGSCTDDR